MSTIGAMTYRAITLAQAQWLGNAPAVAGGYVAVDGPRVTRVSREEVERERRKIAAERDPHIREAMQQSADAANARTPYRIQGGDYAGIVNWDWADDDLSYLVLVVPAGGPCSGMGWLIPAELVRELLPALAEAGYTTA